MFDQLLSLPDGGSVRVDYGTPTSTQLSQTINGQPGGPGGDWFQTFWPKQLFLATFSTHKKICAKRTQ